MDTGDWLTRGTVWTAAVAGVASELLRAVRPANGAPAAARWLNTVGCLLLVAHVAAAFHFHHHWSHAAAYADTARQTREWTGWNWGGGIYLNYLFCLGWLAWTTLDWLRAGGVEALPRAWVWLWRSLFLFMLFNGAVVFARPTARLPGLLLCLILMVAWCRKPATAVNRSVPRPPA
jgi:hypothetical protein